MPLDRTLVTVLRLLAAPADEQIGSFPAYVDVADEVALLFEEQLARLRQARVLEGVPAPVRASLEEIERCLRAMRRGKPECWDLVALQDSEAWDLLRAQARAALEAAGETTGRFSIDWMRYAPARRS